MIRAILLAFTIATLISLYLDRPKTVQSVQVDYCEIDIKKRLVTIFGEVRHKWTKGFGPCSLLDRYENI